MKTVPAFVADLAVVNGVTTPERLEPYGRLVGNVVEVDVGALHTDGDTTTAHWLSTSWRHMRAQAGIERGMRCRRLLIEATQVDTKTTRRDLRDECEALCALPGFGVLFDKLLGTEPDLTKLAAAFATLGGVLNVDGSTATVTVIIDPLPVWPEALGGGASPAETHRELTVVVRWAKWRDRRSRRLASLCVVTLEDWPKLPAATGNC